MLTIVDLHRNEQLSSSSMAKVAGGEVSSGVAICILMDASTIFKLSGYDKAAEVTKDAAWGIALQ